MGINGYMEGGHAQGTAHVLADGALQRAHLATFTRHLDHRRRRGAYGRRPTALAGGLLNIRGTNGLIDPAAA